MLKDTHCKDYSKDGYDVDILKVVSRALGHNRINVTVEHYLKAK